METLNHMYGAVQALGSLDINIIDKYQAVKKKATKIIQKCSELLSSAEKGVRPDPEEREKISKEEIFNGTLKENNGPSPKNSRSILGNVGKGLKLQKGGFGVRPDSSE